jgi:ketosteroid isomerase-like protein
VDGPDVTLYVLDHGAQHFGILRLQLEADTDGVADALIQLMDLRLPLSVRIRAVVPADGVALVLGERHVVGTGPDCEPVQLSGAGATVVRRQQGGSWRIVAEAWYLSGPGAGLART